MSEVFKKRIQELFGDDIEGYKEDAVERTVRFIFDTGMDATLVFKLSDLLGSREISWNENARWGGCPTCDYGAGSNMELLAYDVVFPNVDATNPQPTDEKTDSPI